MGAEQLLTGARRSSGLSQEELAARANTSRPTLSAYEQGRKSPTVDTASRLLGVAGFELTVQPVITFVERTTMRGRVVAVPSSLPRLSIEHAMGVVTLPLHLNWSQPDRQFDLRQRRDRARVYEIVLCEGGANDVLTYVDGALLIDLWEDLVLPRDVRAAWRSLVIPSVSEAA